jgi:hypothetical protein
MITSLRTRGLVAAAASGTVAQSMYQGWKTGPKKITAARLMPTPSAGFVRYLRSIATVRTAATA